MWLEFDDVLHPPYQMQRLQRNITTAKRCMEYCNGNIFGDTEYRFRTRNIFRFDGEINIDEFEDEEALVEDQEAMIANVQPDAQEREARQGINPVISRLDRKRLKTAFYITQGETNNQEIRRHTLLSIPTIQKMRIIYNAHKIFYQGNSKKKYHSEEEVQFIKEYFDIQGNKGKVFRHLKAEFTRLYQKKIGLRFAARALKKEGIWYRIVRKREIPQPDRFTERRRAVRSIIKANKLHYTIVVLDEVHFTKKNAQ